MRRLVSLLALLLALAVPGTAHAAGALDAAGLAATSVGGGIVEAGAVVDVVVSVRNSGTTALTGLRGRLSASTGTVVERDEADFPDLEPGEVGRNAAVPFRIKLGAVTCGEVVHLAVLFSQADGSGVSIGFDLPTGVPGRVVPVDAPGLPAVIPDGEEDLASVVDLSDPGRIREVRVVVGELTHAATEDLQLSLEAPDGTSVRLFDRGRGADLRDTIFADGGLALSGAAGPYSGTFAPARPLAALTGRAIAGRWALRVRDLVRGGTSGTLQRWRLELRPATCEPQVTAALTATPSVVRPGGTVRLDASASAVPDGDAIAGVAWDPEGDGTFTPDGTELALDHAYPVRGAFEAAVRITTRDGLQGLARVRVPVTAPPVANLTAPAAVDALEPVELDARGSVDDDGQIMRYEWDLDGRPGFEVDGGDVPTRSRSFPRSGTYDVRLRVTDDLGATATVTRAVLVRNLAPVARLAALPQVAVLGEPLPLDGTASADRDGTVTEAAFALDDGGRGATGPALSAALAPVRTGPLTASLVVTDDEGAASARSTASTWVTARPVARIEGPADAVGLRAPAPLSGAGSSDDDGPPELAWDLDADGAFDDGTGTVAAPAFARRGDHVVRLRATDRHGIAHVTAATVRVVNQPPVAVLAVSPTPAVPGRPVLFDATASRDPDGAPLGFRFDLDGDGRFETAAGATGQASRSYPAPGLVPVAVQVTDADGAASVAHAVVEMRAVLAPAGPLTGPPPAPAPALPAPAVAAPGEPGAPPPARGDAGAARTTSIVAASLQRRFVVLRRGIALRCDAAAARCTVRATIARADARRLGVARRPRRAVTIGRVSGRPGALRLRLTRAARRGVRRVRRVTVLLRAEAVDRTGRRTVAVRAVVVER